MSRSASLSPKFHNIESTQCGRGIRFYGRTRTGREFRLYFMPRLRRWGAKATTPHHSLPNKLEGASLLDISTQLDATP